jgi:hypothetical protein
MVTILGVRNGSNARSKYLKSTSEVRQKHGKSTEEINRLSQPRQSTFPICARITR